MPSQKKSLGASTKYKGKPKRPVGVRSPAESSMLGMSRSMNIQCSHDPIQYGVLSAGSTNK